MGRIELLNGDCLELLKTLEENSIDSIVTDPPYELGFMGKAWDKTGIAFRPAVWLECLRVLKPGGHLLAFGGSRTFHLIAVAIEDAGFEIRDTIMWLYGSGFPKSHNISIAIDKLAGAEREVVNKKKNGRNSLMQGQNKTQGFRPYRDGMPCDKNGGFREITAPATPAAAQWDGWGTALKPAHEPIILARKPLQGTVAENVLQWGTGGLNVDGCRISTNELTPRNNRIGDNGWKNSSGGYIEPSPLGRWPANIIHDGSEEVVAGFPETTSGSSGAGCSTIAGGCFGGNKTVTTPFRQGDTGSAARFFYCAKASKADRDEGLEGFECKARPTLGNGIGEQPNQQIENNRNHHPTVKPTALMRYLCKLVTPPGGIVLDPFMGSGSTGKAAILEGFRFVGIEREAEYLEIARARINHVAGVKNEPNEPEEPENKPAAISKPQQAKLF